MITRKFDRRIACLAAAALVSLGGTAALATTSSAFTLTFSTTITQSCTIGAGSGGSTLTFNNYNPATTPAAITTVTNMLSVSCTVGGPNVTVNLDGGANFSAGERRMRIGASTHYLSYKIFSDSAGTNELTSTTNLSVVVKSDGTTDPLSISAAIDAGQTTLFAGTYQDTVGATVTF